MTYVFGMGVAFSLSCVTHIGIPRWLPEREHSSFQSKKKILVFILIIDANASSYILINWRVSCGACLCFFRRSRSRANCALHCNMLCYGRVDIAPHNHNTTYCNVVRYNVMHSKHVLMCISHTHSSRVVRQSRLYTQTTIRKSLRTKVRNAMNKPERFHSECKRPFVQFFRVMCTLGKYRHVVACCVCWRTYSHNQNTYTHTHKHRWKRPNPPCFARCLFE